MAKSAIITLTTAGTNTGPFNLLSDVDSYITPFESNVPRASLIAGYTTNLIPDAATIVRIKSNGACTNYIDLTYPGTPTTTTTTSTTTSTTTAEPTTTTTSTTTSTTTAEPTTTTTSTTTTTTTLAPATINWSLTEAQDPGNIFIDANIDINYTDINGNSQTLNVFTAGSGTITVRGGSSVTAEAYCFTSTPPTDWGSATAASVSLTVAGNTTTQTLTVGVDTGKQGTTQIFTATAGTTISVAAASAFT
jgi:hypothetical protein